MQTEKIEVDFCVVGGGLAGLCAAIAAARRGAKVALVHDRPVLGGNSSSEIRMHVCGARGENTRETGLVEELMLDNYRYNTRPTYSGWDAVLYGKAQYQPGLTLVLNASVSSAAAEGGKIRSVRAWQCTTQRWIEIEAALFADCSGDAVLAPLSGALFRQGREARGEYGESIEPVEADSCTMGASCLFQAREYAEPQPFVPLPWTNRYESAADLPDRFMDVFQTNFWWMEVGGTEDTLSGAEKCREELLRIAYGVWDYLKNRSPDRARYERLALDWVGFLPGKRESRRYVGDHVLTQGDVESGGRFPDVVAYGGWPMDDHFPEGFHYRGAVGTTYHPAPSPYGIPYRCLYSRNVGNLFCAGRDMSATHAALSSTRVMATCALEGQAVGVAAAIAVRDGLSPRAVGAERLAELQGALLDDDCWLPGVPRRIPEPCAGAELTAGAGEPEPLRSGIDRPVGGASNGWTAPVGTPVEYRFEQPAALSSCRLVFDSDLDRGDPSRKEGQTRLLNMRYWTGIDDSAFAPPATLVRDFRLEVLGDGGAWTLAATVRDNHQRLVRVPLSATCRGLRLVVERTWGTPTPRVFAFDAT
ncbi:MAG: FAD-dependent oxidoreductase [Kiritimatiellae bacterium]|nr:FAD-dependent oxidoreductase [Kiritimatiellia bacterium]